MMDLLGSMISNCFMGHLQGSEVGVGVLRVVVVVVAHKIVFWKSGWWRSRGGSQQDVLRDARLRFSCDSRVHRLDGGERRHRTVDHWVTDRPFVLQDIDASLQLASSVLDVSLRDHGVRGPHSCTMVWLNLMIWFLIRRS